MKKVNELYEKTKFSLSAINHKNPDYGIELIKEVQHSIKILRAENP